MKRKKYNLDPDYKKYAKINPPLSRLALPFIRGFGNLVKGFQKSDKAFTVDKYDIAVQGGRVRATIISPKAVKTASILIFYHGGGFAYPASPYHFSLAKKLAEGAGCKVALISYRLAPKHKFPTQNEDCFTAYLWVRNNAQTLGIDVEKIVFGGDSAGGNLAVGTTLMAKERNIPLPKALMLLYPALSFDSTLESMQIYTDTPMCSTKDIKKYEKLYLKKGQENNQYLSPVLADLSGFPATYVETAEFDCLRSGSLEFIEKLKARQSEVQVNHTKGTIHAFDIVPNAKITKHCINARIDFLKSQF